MKVREYAAGYGCLGDDHSQDCVDWFTVSEVPTENWREIAQLFRPRSSRY